MNGLLIREGLQKDMSAIEALYSEAFPDVDLVPLVTVLLNYPSAVLSLVGIRGPNVAAHIILTLCRVDNAGTPAALLGPLAVAPDLQRQGIGSRIVRAGLRQLETAGVNDVFVLGDPVYYRRFGFQKSERVTPPYVLPEEWNGAWQTLTLGDGKAPGAGRLAVPGPWRNPELWAP